MTDFFSSLEQYFEESERQRVILKRLEARNLALEDENTNLRARIAELETMHRKSDTLGFEHLVSQNRKLLALLAGRSDAEVDKVYNAAKELYEIKQQEKVPLPTSQQVGFEPLPMNETPRLVSARRIAPVAPKQPSPLPTSAVQEPIIPTSARAPEQQPRESPKKKEEDTQAHQFKFAFGQTVNPKPVPMTASSAMGLSGRGRDASPSPNAQNTSRKLSTMTENLLIGAETAKFNFAASALPQDVRAPDSSLQLNLTSQQFGSIGANMMGTATMNLLQSTVPFADNPTQSIIPSMMTMMQDAADGVIYSNTQHSQPDVPSKLHGAQNLNEINQTSSTQEIASADMQSLSDTRGDWSKEPVPEKADQETYEPHAYEEAFEEERYPEFGEEMAETQEYDDYNVQTQMYPASASYGLQGPPAAHMDQVVDISDSEPGI